VSAREYYCYLFQIRNPLSQIHLAGRLFQQYAVDNYVKIETERLDWLKENQHVIRADSYKGFMDMYETGERLAAFVGK
jgi:hypothetical protein